MTLTYTVIPTYPVILSHAVILSEAKNLLTGNRLAHTAKFFTPFGCSE